MPRTDWSLTAAAAIVLVLIAAPAEAGSGQSAHQQVSVSDLCSQGFVCTATVRCAEGKQVLGGGPLLDEVSEFHKSGVAVVESYPLLEEWVCAIENTRTDNAIVFQCLATCAALG